MIPEILIRDATCSNHVKHHTKAIHAAVEKLVIPRLKHIQSTGDYANVLALFYGFFLPLETVVHSYITEVELPDIAKRRSVHNIKSDLSVLENTAPLEVCPDLPAITNTLQAFGALYVLEGSTLGGVHIAKMLKANPFLGGCAHAFHFFDGYGNDTETMWNAFKQSLNTIATSDTAMKEVTASANETFEKFKRWIENN